MLTDVLCTLCKIYVFAIFVRIVLTWVPIQPDNPVGQVQRFLVRVTEPLMGPMRRALPPLRLGGIGRLDLSPILVLILIQWVFAGVILNCG